MGFSSKRFLFWGMASLISLLSLGALAQTATIPQPRYPPGYPNAGYPGVGFPQQNNIFGPSVVNPGYPPFGANNTFGTGYWGANQACQYQPQVSATLRAAANNYSDANKNYSKAREEEGKAIEKVEDLSTQLLESEGMLWSSIKPDFRDPMMKSVNDCDADRGPANIPKGDWSAMCVDGKLSPAHACSFESYVSRDFRLDCIKHMEQYATAKREKEKADNNLKVIVAKREAMERRLGIAQDRARNEMQREGIQSTCVDCLVSQIGGTTSGFSKGSMVLDAIQIGLEYKLNSDAMEINKKMGNRVWPYTSCTQPGFGFPFSQGNQYGCAYGGLSRGGFGCSNTIGSNQLGPTGLLAPFAFGSRLNPGGAFGYPRSYNNSSTWGPMLPGCGTWGCNRGYNPLNPFGSYSNTNTNTNTVPFANYGGSIFSPNNGSIYGNGYGNGYGDRYNNYLGVQSIEFQNRQQIIQDLNFYGGNNAFPYNNGLNNFNYNYPNYGNRDWRSYLRYFGL